MKHDAKLTLCGPSWWLYKIAEAWQLFDPSYISHYKPVLIIALYWTKLQNDYQGIAVQ